MMDDDDKDNDKDDDDKLTKSNGILHTCPSWRQILDF